jgi:hypothetical protein
MYEMARELSEKEKRDYIIYKYGEKTYFEAVECWKKGGSPGELQTLILCQGQMP